MPNGLEIDNPGKYHAAAKAAREATSGEVVLIVFNGKLGNGFEVMASLPILKSLPSILRGVADDIERETRQRAS